MGYVDQLLPEPPATIPDVSGKLLLGRKEIEAKLPHRGAARLVDGIARMDIGDHVIGVRRVRETSASF